jgi:hypothetical protein
VISPECRSPGLRGLVGKAEVLERDCHLNLVSGISDGAGGFEYKVKACIFVAVGPADVALDADRITEYLVGPSAVPIGIEYYTHIIVLPGFVAIRNRNAYQSGIVEGDEGHIESGIVIGDEHGGLDRRLGEVVGIVLGEIVGSGRLQPSAVVEPAINFDSAADSGNVEGRMSVGNKLGTEGQGGNRGDE